MQVTEKDQMKKDLRASEIKLRQISDTHKQRTKDLSEMRVKVDKIV
jgi:hypothetical protein